MTNPTAIAAGAYHTCAIDDGDVVCWGAGKENTNTDYEFGQNIVPDDLSNPTQISAGDAQTCILDDNGVRCWGLAINIEFYQASDFPLSDDLSRPDDTTNPTVVAAGYGVGCLLESDGAMCWGEPLIPDQNRIYFQDVETKLDIRIDLNYPTAISIGFLHACALHDGGLSCWENYDTPFMIHAPPLGSVITDSDRANLYLEIIPKTLSNPSAIAAGALHTCVIDDNGVTCWEEIMYSVIGFDSESLSVPSESVPSESVPSDIQNPKEITAGYNHTCVVDDSGVICWGSGMENAEGEDSYLNHGQSIVPASLRN